MTMYFEARYEFSPEEEKKAIELVDKLLKNISSKQTVYLSATVQYLDIAKKVMAKFKTKLKPLPKHNHSCYDCQILGCSDFVSSNKNAVFVNIVDGLFHSKILKINNPDSVVYSVNLQNFSFLEVTQTEIQSILNAKKAAISKFYVAKKIGVVVNLKPGQLISDPDLDKLKKFLERQNKDYQIFLSDSVDLSEFDNFNFIDYWINTACPRLSYDDAVEHKRLFAYWKDLLNAIG